MSVVSIPDIKVAGSVDRTHSAEHMPLLNLEMGPDRLHVRNQVGSSVVGEARGWLGVTRAALIEQHNPVRLRIKALRIFVVGPASLNRFGLSASSY